MLRSSPLQLAVDRAASDFRRGVPVILFSEESAILACAAETADDDAIETLSDASGTTPLLALTGVRARALKIGPTGHDTVLIPMTPWLDITAVRDLPDATHDLERPLRGPFDREKRPPNPAESAAVALAKLARLLPAALLAHLPDAGTALAEEHGLLRLPARAVQEFEVTAAEHLKQIGGANVPLADVGMTRLVPFRPDDGGIEHLAIVVGDIATDWPVLVRLHSECFTGDLIGSLKCDCGEQLRGALKQIADEGAGILLYLAQEGRGIGLINKLRAYRLQEDGFDTVDSNLKLGFDADERIFQPAAEMLRRLGVRQVRLMTNNPDKIAGLEACGITVSERVEHSFPANAHNEFYLTTKRLRSGHLF